MSELQIDLWRQILEFKTRDSNFETRSAMKEFENSNKTSHKILAVKFPNHTYHRTFANAKIPPFGAFANFHICCNVLKLRANKEILQVVL